MRTLAAIGRRVAVALVLLVLGTTNCGAAGGPNVFGVGADNIAMAGAGVARADEPFGALAVNPALLARLDGDRFAMAGEVSQQASTVSSRVATPIGAFTGSTDSDRDEALPAFAWTHHQKNSRAAYGVAFHMTPGFGVDYAQDPTNPILAPQPNGFGGTSSTFRMGVTDLGAAWQLSDGFSLGVAANVARAELAMSPATFATPNCSGPTGPCFFPSVNSDTEWGYGLTVGAHYQLGSAFALGLSYDTGANFADFEWNSAVANPGLPTFGTGRPVTFALDTPSVATLGMAWTPNERFAVALDGRRIGYGNADGFSDTWGFDDVTVVALGVEWMATDRFTLRGGYSHGDSPVAGDQAFRTIAVPVLVEDFAALGVGFRITDSVALDLAYGRGAGNDVSGPFLGPAGTVPGTTVTNEASFDTMAASLSWRF